MDYYYNLVSPPSQVAILVAKKLNIKLNLKKTNIYDPAEMEALSKINPHQTLPMLVDSGTIVFESHAIVLYLVETYAKDDALYPKDAKVRCAVNQCLFFDVGTLYKQIYENIHVQMQNRQPSEKQTLRLKRATDVLEGLLTERSYTGADQLTVADICLLVTVSALKLWLGYDLKPYPRINKWFRRVTDEIPDCDKFQREVEKATRAYVASRKC
uniref:glutathione transferase n=1 Tax=Anopheles epiroticus TaxID=199890 RepID=A0A182PZ25_9DIPT